MLRVAELLNNYYNAHTVLSSEIPVIRGEPSLMVTNHRFWPVQGVSVVVFWSCPNTASGAAVIIIMRET